MSSMDDALLLAYMNTFYGYGTYQAPYWLIGMEQGGDDLAPGLNVWDARGRPELEDLFEYGRATGLTRWFGRNPPLQSTWKQMMRLVHHAKGIGAPTLDEMRA